ncbi:MAG: translation initiation factor IF-3 [Alphaproteobacteria bacterium]|nr:translation initiation factor IF-3 [Alphaproteobacteria bacterium]OJV46318.1 MAG: translation initiation factor IF-3 [Alphaproteobacteria bacterium 43-37]
MSTVNQDGGPRVNQAITSAKVRLVDENGEMVGIVSKAEALQMAEEASLDLVEVSPNADPPVCKILDYGKYKYEAQKKKAEAKKKQKVIEIKEIKMRPVIDENDYQVKMRNVRRFLEDGDKVKITMRFRGREMSHQELGMEILQRIQEELKDSIKIEQTPKLEGKQIILIMAPATG